jgi:hypothetical protein
MQIRLYHLKLCAFLSGLGCSTSTEPSSLPPLMPLAVGNKWIHTLFSYDTSGVLQHEWQDSIYISRDTLIDGERWYIRPVNRDLGAYTNRETGLWYRLLGPTITMEPQLVHKYPARIGDSYPFAGSDVQETVISLSQTVTTPAGSFSCLVYQVLDSTWMASKRLYFMAPGVGPVRYEQYNRLANGSFVKVTVTELLSIRIAH